MSAESLTADGWQVVRFGDVVSCVNNSTKDPAANELERVVGLDHMDPGLLPLRRWDWLGDLPDGTSFTRTFKSGQVLFGKRRAYQRKVSVPDFDGICSGDILVFESSSPDILQEFLPYVVQSEGFFEHALGTSAGSLSPRTKWQELAKYTFGLPPIPEQRRIAEVLNSSSYCCNSYGVARMRLQELREALLADAAGGSALKMQPLSELAAVVSGESWAGTDECSSDTDGATPVIGISSLRPDGSTEHANPTYVLGLATKKSLFTVDSRSILIIRTNGNAERIGNVYLASPEIEGRALSAFIFGCRFNSRRQAELAFEFMRGRSFQKWATSLVAGTTGLKNLPIGKLRMMKVPFLDTEEAEQLLKRLQALRALERQLSICNDRVKLLYRDIRETMLSGGPDVH